MLYDDNWFVIAGFLDYKSLIKLWSTCRRLQRICYKLLKQKILNTFGYELLYDFDRSKSSLSTVCYLKPYNNYLTNNKYFLTKDLMVNVNDYFFIVNGDVNINFNNYNIYITKGTLFYLNSSNIKINTINVIAITNEITEFSDRDFVNINNISYNTNNYNKISCFYRYGVCDIDIKNTNIIRYCNLPYGPTGLTGSTGCGPTSYSPIIITQAVDTYTPIQHKCYKLKNTIQRFDQVPKSVRQKQQKRQQHGYNKKY